MVAPASPPGPAELERRTWHCLASAGRPLTVPELADLAGITRGGALRFLTGWAAAGQARRSAPAGGRYAPYAALFTASGGRPGRAGSRAHTALTRRSTDVILEAPANV